jgi:ribonuclease E
MAYLLKLWETILAKAKDLPAPAVVYQERDLVIRSIRDYFTPDIAEILVDDREVFRQAREFLQSIMPRYVTRMKLYREKRPIFSKYQLEDQIEAIFEDKIPLKSGGSIVIDRTEAMVAIDVNSGRSTQERGMEETAFKTNMEAGEEIARQLRLRDLGGLIVIDFIDMRDRKHIQEVERGLKNALKRDKARTEMSRISKFGLLEVSRQRLKPALQDETTLPCPHCKGQGLIRSRESLGLTVLRKIQAAAVKGNIAAAKARVPLEVGNYLLNEKRDRLLKLEHEYDIRIYVEGDAQLTGSLFNLVFEKRDVTLVEEALVGPEVQPVPEVETISADELAAQEAEEEIRPAADLSEPEAFEEETAEVVTAAEPTITVAASVAANELSSPAVVQPISDDNGSRPKRESPPPPWQPVRRHGRFWWLRRLVPTTSGPPRESSGNAVAGSPSSASEALSGPPAAPLPAATIATEERTTVHLPDDLAPWRRMLPPITFARQLPLRRDDEAVTGNSAPF